MKGEVASLTRNIIIEGEINTTKNFFGARVLISEYRYVSTNGDVLTKTGQ